MSYKFPEELKDDQIRYKYFDFHKLNPQNGMMRKSSTKFKSVRSTSYKKIVVPEPIDLSDTIYANGKFMTEEMPKYVDGNNSKQYLRSMVYNFDFASPEPDQETSTKVNKKQTEKFSKKLHNPEQSKIKSSKGKSKSLHGNNNRDSIKNPTKSHLIKNIKKKESCTKPLRDDTARGQKNTTNRQSLFSFYDNKDIKVIKEPNSTLPLVEPNGIHKTASSMEKQINGYIEKLIRKFEDSPNEEVSPYCLPKKGSTQKNYKTKTTIVTSAGTHGSFGKINLGKKNSQQNEAPIEAKAKSFWHNSKLSSKNNVARVNSNSVSKTEQSEIYRDDYLRCASPLLTNSRNSSENQEDRFRSKSEQKKVIRDHFLPYTSPPLTKSKNILKHKEVRVQSKTTTKTEQTDLTRDNSLPYTSPPIIKSKGLSKDRISSKPERIEIVRNGFLSTTSPSLTNNKSTKQNSAGKTLSLASIPEEKKSLQEIKVFEKKTSKSKIIASEGISRAVEKKSSDAKCPLPQRKLSKIKELLQDIRKEESFQVIENKTSGFRNTAMNFKTQLTQIKELIQTIVKDSSPQTIEKKSSSAKCLLVPEDKQSNKEIKMSPKVVESKESLQQIEKFTARTSLASSKPKRALCMKRNPNITYSRPMKSTSWTSLAAVHSILDITKLNHRMPKSYICSKRKTTHKYATLKNFKQKLKCIQTKKSSLTFTLSYKDTLLHISSSVFHTSISVPSIKKVITPAHKNDFIVKSNSQDFVEIFKFGTNLNQTLEHEDAGQPLQVDFKSVIQLFVPDKKSNKATVKKKTSEKLKKNEKKMSNKRCCGHKTVVLCQRRPEFWWTRAHTRNCSKNAKKCNCDYCKTMAKYLPQIENSAASIITLSDNSVNESSETVSLDMDTFSLVSSSYENLVKIDPLYTKLMADTKQNKLVQLLKYEPHSFCYSSNCEKCRNTLQNIAYCKTNRSETDLNLISKLKEHKHETNCSQDFDVIHSSVSRKNIFRKIKLSTTRIITTTTRVESLKEVAPKEVENALAVVKEMSEKQEPHVSPKMSFQHSIPKKPALKGGNIKSMDTKNITSKVIIKKNKQIASMTTFSKLRNVFTMFVSFHIKILDFITFGKLNLLSK